MGRIITLMKLFTTFANRSKDATAALEGDKYGFQFDLAGEAPFYIFTDNDHLKFEKGKMESADATFETDKKTFYKIFSGEISQDEAFQSRKVEVKGSMAASIRFRRMANILLASHKTSMKLLRIVIRVIPL